MDTRTMSGNASGTIKAMESALSTLQTKVVDLRITSMALTGFLLKTPNSDDELRRDLAAVGFNLSFVVAEIELAVRKLKEGIDDFTPPVIH